MPLVIPAKAGTQRNRHHTQCLDPGLRRDDEKNAGMMIQVGSRRAQGGTR